LSADAAREVRDVVPLILTAIARTGGRWKPRER
jgi:hypothetical protein